MNGISEMPCFKNYYTTDTLPHRIVKTVENGLLITWKTTIHLLLQEPTLNGSNKCYSEKLFWTPDQKRFFRPAGVSRLRPQLLPNRNRKQHLLEMRLWAQR